MVVILGTGGTIAGTAADAADNVGYCAAQIGVAALVAAVPPLASMPIECEQVAQVDSKDMGPAVWQRLVERAAHHLAREDVHGIVVTHGTDTLEETAYLLHRVLAPSKPLVLTAAMRPATSLQADGPQNLLDAVTLAKCEGARGVLAVMAGQVHRGDELRKWHSYRLDAFTSGDAGPLGRIVEGTLERWREWPEGEALGVLVLQRPVAHWPRVEIVLSHAGADARLLRLLVQDGVQGIVVAATGNGTVHEALQGALEEAHAAGVAVIRASRCAAGGVVDGAGVPLPTLPSASRLTPCQARVELLLRGLAGEPPNRG